MSDRKQSRWSSRLGGGLIRQAPSTHGSRAEDVIRNTWKSSVRLAIVLACLGALAHWAQNVVDRVIKGQVASQLSTSLDSTEAALQEWNHAGLRRMAEVVDQADFVEAAAALVNPDSARTTSSENAANLLGELNSIIQRSEAEGYLLTDRNGTVRSATKYSYVGQRIPLDEKEYKKWMLKPEPRLWSPVLYPDGGPRPPRVYMTRSIPVVEKGAAIAVLHLLVDPSERFSEILRVARPGKTGETYAFDRNGVMISESRFLDDLKNAGILPRGAQTTVLAFQLRDQGEAADGPPGAKGRLTKTVRSALANGSGMDVEGYNDYRGVSVAGAWRWYPQHQIGVATKLDIAEAFVLRRDLRIVLGVLFALLVGAAIVAVWFSYRNLGLVDRSRRAEERADRLGQYTLGEKLGEGGMGAVYVAHHQLLRRPTAIKLIKPPQDGEISPERFERFEREVQHTAELTHPNTISVYDFGKTPAGVLYYAMEYLEGVDLDELVEQTGPLPEARAVYLLLQACGSLAEAHQRGMIHRDIKPGNLMVCERGGEHDRLKVLDFGLVKSLLPAAKSKTVTMEGAITGTPAYLAPETLTETEAASARSDIYALGGVLYFLLAGQDLFPHKDGMAMMIAQISEEPVSLSQVAPNVSPELCQVVHDCLKKNPGERPQTAQELAKRLREVVQGTWDAEMAQAWWNEHGPALAAKKHGPGDEVKAPVFVASDQSFDVAGNTVLSMAPANSNKS